MTDRKSVKGYVGIGNEMLLGALLKARLYGVENLYSFLINKHPLVAPSYAITLRK